MEDKDTQEYIGLLEAFKLSLYDNKSTEKNQVIKKKNKTITNLKTGEDHAVALTSELFNVVSLVKNSMALNEFKLNNFQGEIWNKLRNSVYARYTQDKNALDFIHWGLINRQLKELSKCERSLFLFYCKRKDLCWEVHRSLRR